MFELNPFKFKFELGYINYTSKKLGENTWRCPEGVEPQNQSHTVVPHLPSTHGRHREFDLDLK
jgi:hypothetical protein